MISASAQSAPSTRASALIFTRLGRTLTISAVIDELVSRDDGRRKRALSMPDRNISLVPDGSGSDAKKRQPADLRHRLDDQDARHDRVPREVALEELLVDA